MFLNLRDTCLVYTLSPGSTKAAQWSDPLPLLCGGILVGGILVTSPFFPLCNLCTSVLPFLSSSSFSSECVLLDLSKDGVALQKMIDF